MKEQLAIGQAVPDFAAHVREGETIRLADLRGKHVVLYFYPKDNTPGCTQEGIDFSALQSKFHKAGAVVLGVSRDSIKCHDGFKKKHDLQFELISDADESLCKVFDVIKMKNMYGKQVRGIERSTFLIDKKGILRQQWRKVKVPGHAEEVLAAVKAL